MAQVTVTVNGKRYAIACEDGQEAHLTRLSGYVDKRLKELVAAIGQVGEDRLLVMVSLLIADELSDVYAEIEALREADAGITARLEAEENRGDIMNKMAVRIEKLAERIEQA